MLNQFNGEMGGWQILSVILGWIYFLSWSGSFYPQLILTWRRKSSLGLSLDFCLYNVWGFFCYTIYTASFLFDPRIRLEYRNRNAGKDNLVQINDLVFAANALIVSSLIATLAFRYRRPDVQHVSIFAKTALSITLGLFIILYLSASAGGIQLLDFLYYVSSVKMMSTLFKYCPQAYMNYRRKSTAGWSIVNVLLDFTGGVCSLLQLFLDAILEDNMSGISGNAVKLVLGIVTLIFDSVFIIQHYILYNKSRRQQRKSSPAPTDPDNAVNPLLPNDSASTSASDSRSSVKHSAGSSDDGGDVERGEGKG